MSRQIKSYVTREEYLAIERKAEYKSEYLDGGIFAMTGASRKHNLISASLVTLLNLQLRGKPCEVYSDMRLKVSAAGLYTYADVVVVCGDPRFEDDCVDTLVNPTLVIEVLLKSTERYDRIAKSGYYRTLEPLSEYLLVAQEEYRIKQFTRQINKHWQLSETESLQGVVDLSSIGCSLALRDVYDKICL
jgi:Uma2 family endonuclease